ncbi:hypothetical protein ZHAS_00018751 [Anopheles sinensis]|uniref:Uncharacterized protein n=1 Tax=Anopheles sinensis TaxID=74873 RepID=A0A084WKG6_ANOSI|nr:hypothetical protein ZHAS_00018751 [Anopheles sinensis]
MNKVHAYRAKCCANKRPRDLLRTTGDRRSAWFIKCNTICGHSGCKNVAKQSNKPLVRERYRLTGGNPVTSGGSKFTYPPETVLRGGVWLSESHPDSFGDGNMEIFPLRSSLKVDAEKHGCRS